MRLESFLFLLATLTQIVIHKTVATNSVAAATGFPTYIPTSGSFNAPVTYTTDGTNTLVIDILMVASPYTWYGKGTVNLTPGSGTTTVSCSITTPPPAGSGTMLKVWLVSTSVYTNNPSTAYLSSLTAQQYPLNVGTSSGGGGGGGDGGGSIGVNTGDYDFVQLLNYTLLFYEAQRSGVLPANNRIPWRGNSAVNDKGNNGEDLSGGWYDAGDGVKFGFPMAWSTTVLAWSLVDHREIYESTGQLQYALANLKWTCDYFIKCHVSANEFYGQVGNGELDHAYWGRPEDMTMSRPAYKIDTSNPGSDLAGETAAALAASSIVFRVTDSVYADTLLSHAEALYNFANTYRGVYSVSISDAATFYSSGGYYDELAWSAAWIYRASGQTSYLNAATSVYSANGLGYQTWAFSWDQKSPGLMALMYKITGTQSYQTDFEGFMTSYMPGGGISYTPSGIVWRDQWGSLRYVANACFLALMDADYINGTDYARAQSYRAWAITQMRLLVGDAGRSYVVGFGYNPPTHCHHRAASCKDSSCGQADFSSPNPNPHVIYGALVGGPAVDDTYVDVRSDYQKNEVACDYNAGFTGAVARLAMESPSALNTVGGGGGSSASSTSPLWSLFVAVLLLLIAVL